MKPFCISFLNETLCGNIIILSFDKKEVGISTGMMSFFFHLIKVVVWMRRVSAAKNSVRRRRDAQDIKMTSSHANES